MELREKNFGGFWDKEGELPGKLLSGNRNNTLIMKKIPGWGREQSQKTPLWEQAT